MKKNKKVIVSAFSVFVLILNLFLPAAASAFSFSLPSLTNGGSVSINMNDVLQDVADSSSLSSVITNASESTEDRYGINKDIWRTAQRKVSAPTVEISFDNTNPKAGEKVTATAVPQFFKNDPKNLYYTWYIIHTTDGTAKTATNTISGGKIEAARIMAKGDYDYTLDEQKYTEDSENPDPDKDGWPAVDKNTYNDKCSDNGSEADRDNCSFAPMGGSDGVGGLTSDSNKDKSLSEYCGSEPASSDCSLYTTADAFGSYYRFNGTQTNTYCDSCSSQSLSWGTLSSNNQCCYNILYPSPVTDPDDPNYTTPYDSATNYCPSSYNVDYESCFSYAALKTSNEGVVNTCLTDDNSDYVKCVDDYNTIHSSSTEAPTGQSSSSFTRCFKHDFGTSTDASGYQGYEGSSNSYNNDTSGQDYNIPCEHQWEDAPGYTSGSGKFTTGEEKYWKTDPYDPDTSGDGFNDEASIIGLGQETFSWTYAEGDRVGVVVEGTSMLPTDEKNAYYKIMWAYPDICDSSKAGLMADDQCGENDYGYGFLATTSPSEESTEEQLQVSLSSSPENPVADPSDDNKDNIETDGTITDADQITVTSSLDSTTLKPANLYYTWYIQKKNSKGEWEKMDISTYFDTSSSSSGMGISSFQFTPKKKAMGTDTTTFKVTVAVSRTSEVSDLEEDTSGRTTPKKGWASTEVSVNPSGIKINLYKVSIEDSKATFDKSKDEICDKDLYKVLCPAAQYQIMAAKISGSKYTKSNSEFSWTLNGETLTAPTDASSLFDSWDDVTVFFPITKGEQEIETLSVTATPTNSLEPVTGSRLITVVTPALFIKSSDTSTSWTTTQTVEDSSTKSSTVDIENTDILEAEAGSEVSYYLTFVPDYLLADDPDNTLIDWTIDGESWRDGDYESDSALGSMTTESDDQTAKFTVSETEGTSYTLEASIKKYWSDEEKTILSDAWGISPQTLEGETSVTITTVVSEDDTAGIVGGSQQILAAIGTHLPHYFMYILRLALTLAVMFFLSVGFYALSSKLEL